MDESDFRTEWHARVAALRLAFECDSLSSVVPVAYARCERPKQKTAKTVSFADSFSLFCSSDDRHVCSSFYGPHGTVQQCIRYFCQKYIQVRAPQSAQAVLSSLEVAPDISSFVQKPVHSWGLCQHNEPDAPEWYPPPETGVPQQIVDDDVASEHSDSSHQESPDDHDSEPDPDPPDEPMPRPPENDPNRQSALLYHLADPPVHAMVFWSDFGRFMQEIALHFQIPRENLFDAYELNARPKDLPDSTVPLIVNCVNDFPHGNSMALVLVDIEIHGNQGESHYQTFPDTRRKVIPMPSPISREGLLQTADVFEYCRLEHLRCLVEINHVAWPLQQNLPKDFIHGDYVRILIPPPERCRESTHEVLFDSQVLSVETFWSHYYNPTSSDQASEHASNHSDVSPSLIDSEQIRAEFGPQHTPQDSADEHSQLQVEIDAFSLMQQSEQSSSSSHDPPALAPSVAQIVGASCLLIRSDCAPLAALVQRLIDGILGHCTH